MNDYCAAPSCTTAASTCEATDTFDFAAAAKTRAAAAVADPEIFDLIERENYRQRAGIELIASENFVSPAVLHALGSCLTNKYSEGYPGNRYYGGNEVVDEIEDLCRSRALKAFDLDPSEWHVNVQTYSGSPANFAVYTAFLRPHGRLMGMDLIGGGHLTHGFYTAKKRVSASSIYFEPLPYLVDPETGRVDMADLRKKADGFRPDLIICGASSYPRVVEFQEFRDVADACGAMLMADVSHIAGLIATGYHPSPFPHCDIVTTTTHKTLRGPRSALIFVNLKRLGAQAAATIDNAVFPGLQGGPHNHQIAAVAVQLKEVMTDKFRLYIGAVVANSATVARRLIEAGQTISSGGTDNHLVLWSLKKEGVSGPKFEKLAEAVGISLNKNSVPGDTNTAAPSGVRVGTAAMTTRGCGEPEINIIVDFLLEVLALCKTIQAISGKKLTDFTAAMTGRPDIADLRRRVEQFALKLDFPTTTASAKSSSP